MTRISIEKPGLLTSFQDEGRRGLAFYGIPKGGWMDERAAAAANIIVGNPAGHPVLECSLIGPTIRFENDALAAICGADMGWRLDDIPAPLNKSFKISAGQLLSSFRSINGFRSYLAIRGLLDSTKSFGSYSTDPVLGLGANQGKALKRGDIFDFSKTGASVPSHEIEFSFSSSQEIPLSEGPEFHLLAEQSIEALFNENFEISPESNRMGSRLNGPQLILNAKEPIHSLPLLPGFIQLLPSGKLVVILRDGQTTGGYPRVAFMSHEDLNRFNQIPLKFPFSFVRM